VRFGRYLLKVLVSRSVIGWVGGWEKFQKQKKKKPGVGGGERGENKVPQKK